MPIQNILAAVLMLGSAGAVSLQETPAAQDGGIGNQAALDAEIVVLGRRATRTLVKYNVDGDSRKTKCKVVRSSGDKVLDDTVCQSIRACARVEPLTQQTLWQCVNRERAAMIRQIALHN